MCLKTAEKDYYQNLFEKKAADMKSTWKNINMIINKESSPELPTKVK